MSSLHKIGLFAVFLVLACAAQGQIYIQAGITVEANSPALSECELDMTDSATQASYPSVGVQCYEYANNQLVRPVVLTSGNPEAYWFGSTTWAYGSVYRTEMDSYLFLASNGSYYLDPLGYLGWYACGTGNNYICPENFFFNPANPYIQFPHLNTGNIGPPVVPIISPQHVTVFPGQSVQFTAVAADSLGRPTSTPAPVTWSVAPGPFSGTIDPNTGIYTASSIPITSPNLDFVVATGRGAPPPTAPSQSAQATVTVNPSPPPAPTIVLGDGSGCQSNTPITTPQNVFVGQPIQFAGCVPSSQTSLVTSESWTPLAPPNNSAIGQFSVTLESEHYVQFTETLLNPTVTNCTTSAACTFNKFYFTLAGTYTFTFEYGASGQTAQQSITFIVAGPTPDASGKALNLAFGEVGIYNKATWSQGKYNNFTPGPGWLAVGDGNSDQSDGVNVTSITAIPPSGSNGKFIFVQVLNNETFSFTSNPMAGPFVVPTNSLDTTYPYSVGFFNDTPGLPLNNGFGNKTTFYAVGEAAESFNATVYMLWDPMIPAPGSPSACSAPVSRQLADGTISYSPSDCVSVPVPVASFTWGWSGDALQTLNPGVVSQAGTWILNCPPAGTAPSQPQVNILSGTGGYPRWGNTANNAVQF